MCLLAGAQARVLPFVRVRLKLVRVRLRGEIVNFRARYEAAARASCVWRRSGRPAVLFARRPASTTVAWAPIARVRDHAEFRFRFPCVGKTRLLPF